MQLEQAHTIALRALAYFANDEILLGKFLAQSGMSPQKLKENIKDPAFLGGVLDYVLSDDEILLEFCRIRNLSPETITKARQVLPGAEVYE